jgi:Xaa-Pro aminopeptidase
VSASAPAGATRTPRHPARLAAARAAVRSVDVDWLLLPPSPDLVWLCDAHARSTERLVAFALPREGEPFCVVPRLEAEALAAECPWLELAVWEEHEDPYALLARRLGLERRPRVLVGEGLRVAVLLRLATQAACAPAAGALAPLRAVKDAGEIRLLEQAARHADAIVEETADFMRPGMTETEVANFVTDRFRAAGDAETWVIVASGPHSALPHHQTSERRLAADEPVLLDLGAFTGGYGSDITRTYWLGAPPAEFARIFAVVDEARARGIEAARAGTTCEEVDRAARGVIEHAGHGAHFIHRTGHGVGLEVHEPPYLVAGSRILLERGMVHSVEPGIYLPGRYGVRLEDLVVVEEGGGRRLNEAPRDPRPPRLRA